MTRANTWRKEYFKTGLAVLAILLFYWHVSFGVYSMKWDILNWFFPMRQLVGEMLQAHLLPLWNPYINLGYPLGIDPQSGSLYPITWLIGYFFGYSIYVIGLEFVLHTIIGFWGFKKLGQTLGWSLNTALVVGLLYAGCGFMVGNSQHLTYIISAAWMPWILNYYFQLWDKTNLRAAAGLSLAMALLLTGGYPAFFLTISYTLLVIFLGMMIKNGVQKKYAFCKRMFVLHGLSVFLFSLQILCFIRFFVESMPLINRTEGLTLAQVQLIPFSPQGLLTLLFPFMVSSDIDFWQTDISMLNVYFGLGAFVLVMTQVVFRPSKKVLAIFVVGLIFMGISFGDFFFLRGWLYHSLPFMDMFRYPALFRLFFILLFLVLTGIGLERLRKEKEISFSRQLQGAAIAVAIISVTFFIYQLNNANFQLPETFSATGFHDFVNKIPMGTRFLLQAPFQLLFIIVFIFSIRKKSIKILYLLLVLDIFTAVQLNSFSTIICEQPIQELQGKLDALPDGFLTATNHVTKTGHLGDNRYYPIFNNHSMLRKDIAKNGYNNLQLSAYAKFHPTEKFKDYLNHPPFFTQPESSIELLDFTPNELVIRSDSKEERQLIFLQMDYPGWEVTVNNQSAKLSILEEAPVLAVDLKAGIQEVRFKFAPKGYRWFLGISFFSTLGVFLWMVVNRKPYKVTFLPNLQKSDE